MSRLEPIPIEVATTVSVEEGIDRLREVTREFRGFSIMAHRQIRGTVSRDRVILRRGTIPGWGLSRNRGEFRGSFVAQGDSAKLRGEFVEITGPGSDFVVALAVTLVLLVIYFGISSWRGGELDMSKPEFEALVVVAISFVVALLLRLNRDERRQDVVGEAELLANDIARILND